MKIVPLKMYKRSPEGWRFHFSVQDIRSIWCRRADGALELYESAQPPVDLVVLDRRRP